MIYLKDEATDISVSDSSDPDRVQVTGRGLNVSISADETNALLRGLMRWKLANDPDEVMWGKKANLEALARVVYYQWREDINK